MTKVMMMLGPYPFMLATAAYQTLRRSATYRWAEQARIGRAPAQQFLGGGADSITLDGEIVPHWRGGHGQIALMRGQAARGKPLILLEGYGGFVLGRYVIVQIDETKTELGADGAPSHIAFTMALKEYGADGGGLSQLSSGLAALSALARLI